jgi:hypothetical protein
VERTDKVGLDPDKLTHELIRDVPYPSGVAEETGIVPAGTRVVLINAEGDQGSVIDASGRHMSIPLSSLRELPKSETAS